MHFSLPSSRVVTLSGVVFFAVIIASGCGPGKEYQGKVFAVEGSLRYKDGNSANDLGSGTLELESSSKEIIKITIAGDGTFTRDEKLPAGKYRARIVPPPPIADAEFDLDTKFLKFDTAGLTVTIGDETPQRPTITLTRTQRKRDS